MVIKKITIGFVVQVWDTTGKRWVSQEFVAGDQVDYEDEWGDTTDPDKMSEGTEPYLPFHMIQPSSPALQFPG